MIEFEPGFFYKVIIVMLFLIFVQTHFWSSVRLCCWKYFYHVTARFFEDCAIRLMDVNKDVRDSYQQLIKALPTDLLTRFVPMFILGL